MNTATPNQAMRRTREPAADLRSGVLKVEGEIMNHEMKASSPPAEAQVRLVSAEVTLPIYGKEDDRL
jgi:hypothetical protein